MNGTIPAERNSIVATEPRGIRATTGSPYGPTRRAMARAAYLGLGRSTMSSSVSGS